MFTQGILEGLKGTESEDRLKITNLVKKYGAKTVVDHLTLTVFKNEILVLLGHNGAGKTTTISMLTGLERPTSGAANAFGIDLLNNQEEVTDFIGICPQENVLFEKMTCEENLQFFCRFKGLSNIDAIVEDSLGKFNLTAKKDELAGKVSGGQKRKLQLAIALLGDSKMVLLDEPSSGMDPTARRETWEVIKNARAGRVVILTTHYMDEAEALADRVAIMSKGQLQVCGSSLFLKNKYGTGYHIEVDKLDANRGLEEFEELLNSYLARTHLARSKDSGDDAIVPEETNIPKFEKEVNDAGVLTYAVSQDLAPFFKELFEKVDANLSGLNLKSYNLRVSTLEEVFLEIGKMESKREEEEAEKVKRDNFVE